MQEAGGVKSVYFADYSVVYGALGAVMALPVWLYMGAFIRILGAEINVVPMALRGEKCGDGEMFTVWTHRGNKYCVK